MVTPPQARCTAVFLTLALGIWGTAPAVSQDATDPVSSRETSGSTFQDVVDVRVVNVDVFVFDKKGRPVTGLTRDDFELREDGKPVEITHFREGWSQSADFELPGGKANVIGDQPLEPLESGREPIWAVLFLDTLNLAPQDRYRVLDDLTQFADAQSSDEVRFMLASYDNGLHIQEDFSSDPKELAAALEASAEDSFVGRRDEIEYRGLFRDVQSIYEVYVNTRCPPCQCGWDQMVSIWNQYAFAAADRLRRSTNGLAELISSLGGLPGQKAVFYVSSGLQQRPGIGALNYLVDICPERERDAHTHFFDHDETSFLNELAARANTNRVTLYTIDAGGLRGEASASVDFDSRKFRPSPLTTQTRRMNLQSSLFYLADETGGVSILNENSPFERLQRITQDFENFYSLGFTLTREPDERAHYLKVELPRKPKLNLRYRRSHRDKPPDESRGDQLMAALRLGATSNPLGIRAITGQPEAVDEKAVDLPLHITVPLADLVKIKSDESGRKSLLRVLLAAEDERGRRTEVREKTVELTFSGETPPPTHQFTVTMRLAPGTQHIGIGVLDEVGRTASYTRVAVGAGT